MGRKLADETSGPPALGQSAQEMPGYAPRKRGKLLVVDDDLCMREATGLFLGENGYACTTSDNAVAAIDHLERDRFDLVVTDLHMPEMDGISLLDWVKSRWPTTKVMIITGDTDVGIKAHAIDHGVDTYLVKPFTLDQFLGEVNGCLKHHRHGKGRCQKVSTSKPAGC